MSTSTSTVQRESNLSNTQNQIRFTGSKATFLSILVGSIGLTILLTLAFSYDCGPWNKKVTSLQDKLEKTRFSWEQNRKQADEFSHLYETTRIQAKELQLEFNSCRTEKCRTKTGKKLLHKKLIEKELEDLFNEQNSKISKISDEFLKIKTKLEKLIQRKPLFCSLC